MSEYTPSTAEVRGSFAAAGFRDNTTTYHQSVEEWRAEFDRWLDAYAAEVREQVAREIEAQYLGPDSGRLPDGRDAPDAILREAYDEGLYDAARIARNPKETS